MIYYTKPVVVLTFVHIDIEAALLKIDLNTFVMQAILL